ncbi:MAG: M23 family metallopeptidase [Clostridia bacterium]|nr:M23 family metallopeptidase [Clostridia bacterium]
MQERINTYISTGNSTNQNIAYVDIDTLPVYSLTFLKKNIETSDEEIYSAVASAGITYYHYFAVQLDDEDKYYVSKYSEAEQIINDLKAKDSKNIDDIKIAERYDTKLEEFTDIEKCVSELYEEKKVYVTESGTLTSQYVERLGLDMIEPVSGIITSRFGIRARDNHKGLDIANSMGTTVRASAAGTVTCARYSGGYGNLVIISHGNGIQTYYGHNSKFYVTEGQYVEQGEPLAAMGSTGISTGPHCHFEIRINGVAQNPQNYLFIGR